MYVVTVSIHISVTTCVCVFVCVCVCVCVCVTAEVHAAVVAVISAHMLHASDSIASDCNGFEI